MAPAERPPPKPVNEVALTDIDFDVVKNCNDKVYLKRYIKLIEDDGSYFVDLLRACKDRLLEVAPKDYYLMYPRKASEDEVAAAMKDLLDWETSVKETDAALRNSKKDDIFDDVLPPKVMAPVRGQEPVLARPNVHRKERMPKAMMDDNRTKKDVYARDKSKMKDYYSAWDKVDVDALEDELDKEEREAQEARKRHFEDMKSQQDAAQATTPIEVGEVPGGVPEAHKKHMADTEKEKGNEAFYAKDWEEAEAYYTRSIHYCAADPSTWSNRALVRLKLNKPQKALEDCEHALALNSKYMKALHRKGKALYDLQRYEEAVRWFQLALAESPGNTQINGDLMVARRKLRSDGPADPPKPRAVDAPSSCRIEELNDDDEPSSTTSKGASAAPRPPGYTRIQIEEDSDSEEEQPVAKSAAPGTGSRQAPGDRAPSRGFLKVAIEEVSGSEDDVYEAQKGDTKSSTPAAPSRPAPAARAEFTAAAKFDGARPGFVFKTGDKGLGYYPDTCGATVSKPSPSSGFRKVAIVEESDSDEEAPPPPAKQEAPASRFTPPPRTAPAAATAVPVPVAATEPPTGQAKAELSFDDMD